MHKISFHNILIIIIVGIFIASQLFPNFYNFALHSNYLSAGWYDYFSIQILLYSLLHGSIMHLFGNILFVYLFGNKVESYIGLHISIYLFIFLSLSIAAAILILSPHPTIGISGYAAGLLAFYSALLYSKNDPEYKGGITGGIILIAYGLLPQISFVGHASGFALGLLGFGIYYLYEKRTETNV